MERFKNRVTFALLMKKALTYTLIAGSKACTYDCKICISKMTPDQGIGVKAPEVNWRNFEIASNMASDIYHAENVLITGKGEPTIFPAQITEYLHKLENMPFGKRELQTNGSLIAKGGLMDEFLRVWYDHGLMTVAVSIYHYDCEKNQEVFRPKTSRYFDLGELVDTLHCNGLETRLSCVMLKGYVDSVEEVSKLMSFCKSYGVEQLTLREADCPKNPVDLTVADFVDRHRIDKKDPVYNDIMKFIAEKGGKPNEILPHGAEVYGIDGLQVCATTGLSNYAGEENIRQLIFFPDGMLTTSWVDPKGSAVLHGWRQEHV